MKKLLLTVLCCYIYALAVAQTAAPTIIVKGIAIDSLTNQPQGYVTVALQDTQTKVPVKSNLTKDDGSFELKAPAGKAYQLVLAFVGYRTKVINIPSAAGVTNAGKIKLQAATNQLKEVAVTAVKPLMQQEVDRIRYDA
jgi:hypothetical protein